MDQKQSFSLNADFLNGFASIFMKLVLAIIVIYLLIIILNFLRDKFINKEINTRKADITDLLTILNKLFFISGFGFVIGNIFNVILNQMTRSHRAMPSMNFNGAWDYLTFGIILIFIGIGFNAAKKVLKQEKGE
jgi:hypothetical protein